MPWKIFEESGKYCLYKLDADGNKGNPVEGGCHPTQAEAEAHQKALYANTEGKALRDIPGVKDDDTVTAIAGEIKSLGDGKVGGYGWLFGSSKEKDFSGQWFSPRTDVDWRIGEIKTAYYDHGLDEVLEVKKFGNGWELKRVDEFGGWIENQLNLADQYEAFVEKAIREGKIVHNGEVKDVKMGLSPGSAFRLIRETEDGELLSFPIIEDSFTLTPMEHRTRQTLRPVHSFSTVPFKSLAAALQPQGDSLSELRPEVKSATADEVPATDTSTRSYPMDQLIEAIKVLVPGLTPDQINQIVSVLSLALADPGGVLGSDVDENTANDMMSLDSVDQLEGKMLSRAVLAAGRKLGIKNLAFAPPAARRQTPVKSEGEVPPGQQRPPYNFKPKTEETPAEQEAAAVKSFYKMRFGAEADEIKAVLRDVIGPNYEQTVLDQNRAFAKYLREGDKRMELAEVKALNNQIFPQSQIKQMVDDGYYAKEIKDIMVAAQGTLGGNAIPPNFQENIITRLPGLTAVRGGGATVIKLATVAPIQIPSYTGGDKRYIGNLRGQWGNESLNPPTDQNATLGLETIVPDVYTYRVKMSRSLVESAANLVTLVQKDVGITMALDEDTAELVGDGAGKPRGILPGGTNADGLTEVASGAAATFTSDGVKAVKRGIPTQYRKDGVWVAASDTFGAIERLTVGGGNLAYAFPDLSENELLLNRKAYESEAMPAMAANAYALLFGDLSGYWIVEVNGMTIIRRDDSGTGPNQIWYDVRRLVGGRLVHPWAVCVAKTTVSL